MRISIEEKHSLVARYQAGESVSDICADSGVPKSTFYTWIKPYTVTMTDSGHAVSQQAFIKMKQKLQKLEKKIEILQKVNCTVSASLQEKLQELAKLHGQYSVHALCEALCVSRGTFYNHIFRRKEVTAYLLCSDGLCHELSHKEIEDRFQAIYLKSKDAMIAALRETTELCKHRGETDNITALLLKTQESVYVRPQNQGSTELSKCSTLRFLTMPLPWQCCWKRRRSYIHKKLLIGNKDENRRGGFSSCLFWYIKIEVNCNMKRL